MCGRFAQSSHPLAQAPFAVIAELLRGGEISDHYNICPTQKAVVVRQDEERGEQRADQLRWGLVPSWAKDPKMGNRLFNARSETASSKPSFRSAFKRRRCVVPASGFYEWKKAEDGTKQPHYIKGRVEQPLLFAGLWERAKGEGDEPLETFTILTRAADDFMKPLHDRMPVILCADDALAWMEPCDDKEALEALLGPPPPEMLTAYPVSKRVNNPRNDDEECIEPLGS